MENDIWKDLCLSIGFEEESAYSSGISSFISLETSAF